MQAKSDSAMSISEGKAKGVPMTPTAQIAAIRQRAENAKEIGAVSVAWSQDIPFLLQQIDARESALRALVAQWRETAAKMPDDHELEQSVYAFDSCAYDVERLLESEQ